MLVKRDDVVLLFEAVLPYPVGRVGEGIFVELLEAELLLVGLLEGTDALIGVCERSLELGDGRLSWLFDSLDQKSANANQVFIKAVLQSQLKVGHIR